MKQPKPKKVNFELINPDDGGHTPEPYRLLREVRDKWHEDLYTAKIALAWRKSLKPDTDGHLILGRCVKASDLQRELAVWDFIIVLNREVWQDSDFTQEKKIALLDHELCHAAPALDKQFERRYDEKGRQVWRTRKHDIEEFQDVVKRHGCYKNDLERFAEALLKKRRAPLLDNLPTGPGQPTNGRHIEDMSSGALRAIGDLANTVNNGGIDSFTISTPGVPPVKIDKEAARRIKKNVAEELGRRPH